jgi:hypothetical protein
MVSGMRASAASLSSVNRGQWRENAQQAPQLWQGDCAGPMLRFLKAVKPLHKGAASIRQRRQMPGNSQI